MKDVVIKLRQGKIIIYPTESVFGLGCDPDNENAVRALLDIKHRSWEKGLVLIAAHYRQFFKYVDDSHVSKEQKFRIFSTWPGPTTWVFPARVNSPYWLTGQFSSIAIRVINFKLIQRLCLSFGKPLVSTSANLSGFKPANTIKEVCSQLKRNNFPIICANVLGRGTPSQIRDAVTGNLIRE